MKNSQFYVCSEIAIEKIKVIIATMITAVVDTKSKRHPLTN